MSFLSKLFSSQGLKRQLASLLSVVQGVLQIIPGAESAVVLVNKIAAILGIAGLIHAVPAGTVGKFKLASLASAISALILVASLVPSFQVAVPYLQKLATILGSAVLGAKIAAPAEKK